MMKKHYFLLLIFFLAGQIISAQDRLAKIKYDQAEEAFDKKEYSNTLDKLEEVRELLGTTNPKILYLKIHAQNELVNTVRNFDYAILESLKKDISFFLDQYETVSDEEKYREVFIILEKVNKKYPDKKTYDTEMQSRKNADLLATQNENKKKELANKMNNLAKQYHFVPGKSLQQYRTENKEIDAFVAQAEVTTHNDGTVSYRKKYRVLSSLKSHYTVGILYITTSNGIVTDISYIVASGKKNEEDKVVTTANKLINEAKSSFGPEAVTPSQDRRTFTVKTPASKIHYVIKYSPWSEGFNICFTSITFSIMQ